MSKSENPFNYEFEAQDGFFIQYDASCIGVSVAIGPDDVRAVYVSESPEQQLELAKSVMEWYDGKMSLVIAAEKDFRKNHMH
jgi:hypothetical protein